MTDVNRHVKGHNEKRKYCHFYNNRKKCPYEENGCKYNHLNAGICKWEKNCTFILCQFKHDVLDNVEVKDNPINDAPEKVAYIVHPNHKNKENDNFNDNHNHIPDKCVKEPENELQVDKIDSTEALEGALKKVKNLEETKKALEDKLKLYSSAIRKLRQDRN